MPTKRKSLDNNQSNNDNVNKNSKKIKSTLRSSSMESNTNVFFMKYSIMLIEE